MTQLKSANGFGSHQNDARYSAGVVFRLGEKQWGLEAGLLARFHLQLKESALRRDGCGMGAIARSELFHDALEVNLDRFFRDKELLSYSAIPFSSGDVTKDIDLPVRERLLA